VSRPSPITAARARHRLAAVAARTGIDPHRTAGSVTVRCPLPSHGHPDRTPSLRLHLDDGIFSCFGCGTKGDVVEWVRQTEGVDRRDAITILDSGRSLTNTWAGTAPEGQWRGVPVRSAADPESAGRPEAPDLDRTPSERVYAALEAAWGHYSRPALNDRGEHYLRGRGIDVRVLEAHTGRAEVGHTPAKADSLATALRAEGFSDDELVDAGLAHRRPGGRLLSDFYRQRVLIPIRDDQQHVVGIIGRNVGDQDHWAKYTNPPRTAIYDKSVNLYQPLPAPADRDGQVVVVEGTLDAMAIAVAAIRSSKADQFCPVTQSGRELSAVQLERVIGMHPGTPVLGFDGDRAGKDSAYRHSMAAARQGRAVAVAVLPDGHDPASWLAEHGTDGLAAWVLAGALDTGGEPPEPIPAATHVASYLAAREGVSDTERMAAIVAASTCAEHLPPRAASLWACRIATAAAPLAVAEAHELLVQAQFAGGLPAPEPDHRGESRAQSPPEIDVDFGAPVGPGNAAVLIERVATWGRRPPRAGDPVFLRSPSAVVDKAGTAPGQQAAVHLEPALGRVNGCIEPSVEAATPVLTTDTSAAQAI